MAKKKPSLAQEVAELKSAVALLLKHVTADKEPEHQAPSRAKPSGKVGRKKKTVNDDDDDSRGMRAGNSSKIKKKSKRIMRVEPVGTHRRVNLFDKMVEKSQFKEDTKIDKKLWKGKTPTPRCGRSTLITIDCSVCGNEFDVSPNEVKMQEDDDTGALSEVYTCNDCIRR